MDSSIQSLFIGYLDQLSTVIEKVPVDLFGETLVEGMFPLGVQAQVAANFLIRGYYPLVGKSVELVEPSTLDKSSIQAMLAEIQLQLKSLPKIDELDDSITLSDKAGFNQVNLPQSSYIFRYIIPNFMFHQSMVYAIARAHNVALSKGDFDGFHSYPDGFRFT
ncbi:DUF1993 family protein [Vibrio sp. SCSIO 43136]|uniref:DUF1993 family protein n=1 Tax=Vibrio sp. SCSIO 43136 TaxID=2819101 RepID=UPI002075B9F8|nr:DUF1993 family protein [Vibrio sp. SCSIO 43136]USD64063.1 DUF1993 family protein [Vibrio sp. SCSIO 43136]